MFCSQIKYFLRREKMRLASHEGGYCLPKTVCELLEAVLLKI